MRLTLPLLALLMAAAPALTQEAAATTEAAMETETTVPFLDASETALEDHLWVARPIVVFADTPADPRFQEQIALLKARIGDLEERDVVVITDTDKAARSDIRLKLRPRGFMMVLIGKDGGVKLRKPSPWSTREISRSIDKMPMRQREIREQNRVGN